MNEKDQISGLFYLDFCRRRIFDKNLFFLHIKYINTSERRLCILLQIPKKRDRAPYTYFYMKWKLAACRINKGLKQKEVAELMHTSNTTIVNHETGKVKPTIAQLKMYSQIYEIPEEFIDCDIRK